MKIYYTRVLVVLAFLGMTKFANGQNLKKDISETNKQLLTELTKQEEDRKSRIEAYFLNHPKTKRSFKYSNNSIAYVYDIVNGKPIYRSTDNLAAGRATKANRLHNGGSLGLNLEGQGMTVGVWDGGPVQDTHPEFQNESNTGTRVIIVDNAMSDSSEPGPFSDHGTHVAGTIAAKGVNANALGMAPKVQVKSYNWTNDEAEMALAANAAVDPILISNHSYGIPIQQNNGDLLDSWWMGAYTTDSRDIDNIARNNRKYLIVASAGNSGNVSYSGGLFAGYDKLTTDKNAKNNLVVANANPTVTETMPFSGVYQISNLAINPGSSQGPSDDLRIKPDIAGDGSNLFSPISNNNYDTYSGTSMASPNVAGSLTLIQQYYNQLHGEYMNSSTLKALACHTAIDDIAAVGPDPKFGWGFLNAEAMANLITENENSESLIEELTLNQGQTYTYTFSAQAGEKLIATICWTDMPGVPVNGVLNDPTPKLVNDLDIRITKDGNTFFPWKLDYSSSTGFSNSKGDNIRDNVEKIEIDTPESGMYTLTVSHKGTIQGEFFTSYQDYSLILTGNNLTLGVDDNALSQNLVIFPNPNNGEFTIAYNSSSNNDVKINVYDISGRQVYRNTYNKVSTMFRETIDLKFLESGVYLTTITEGSNSTSHKIIIE